MTEDAPLWRTLKPIRRTKAALSCSKTYFTVVPEKSRAVVRKRSPINKTNQVRDRSMFTIQRCYSVRDQGS